MSRSAALHRARRALSVTFLLLAVHAAVAQTSVAVDRLPGRVRELITSGGLAKATVGVYAVDAKTGQAVIDINSTTPVAPASCNKLFTTAAGLSMLGPDYRFATELFADGTIADGQLKGDLVVRGGGDPTISGRFEADRRDLTRQMRQWADELTSRGVRTITGNLCADATCFDDECFHPTWYPDERAEWYEAEIWGLSFNDGCVDLLWSGKGLLPGDRADVTTNPLTTYVTVDNQVRVAARGRTPSRTYERGEKTNDILATGTIALEGSKEDSAAVHNGALYYLAVLRDVLTSAGISTPNAKMSVKSREEAPQYLKRATLLGRQLSPSLADIVKVINLQSQNFYADCLAKTIGRERGGEGSWPVGTATISGFVRGAGVYSDGQIMVDGSGLSPKNRTTARQLAEVVRYMDQGPLREAWRASLPIGGKRGTLRSRFQETTETRQLAGRIYGKTGLIGGVRSLTGIVTNAVGREFYVSIVVNDLHRGDSDAMVPFIDKVALALAESR